MAVDQKVSKWMRKHGPMRDGELVAPECAQSLRVAGKPSPRSTCDICGLGPCQNGEPYLAALKPDSLKRMLDLLDAAASEGEPVKGVTKGDVLNWFDEIEGLRDALKFIADQEDLTFAECSVAERIIGRAKAALG